MKRFHGIVKLIMTPAAALEIPPVALDGADLFFREYTGKLRVLISRQDVVVLVLQDFKQILIRLSCLCIENHTQIPCYVRPALLSGAVPVIKSVKGIAVPILFFKLTQILYKVFIMLIIVSISGCR